MGASPTRPADAKPNVVAVAWPDGDQDVQRAQAIKPAFVGTLRLETNRAPLPPAAAGRACIAHSRACTSVPRLSSSTRCRPAAPGISLQFLSFHLSPLLCRAVLYSVWTSVIPQRLFISPVFVLLRYIHILVAVVSLQGSGYHLMHACERPS
jgi:hypothetical protein